MAEPYTMWDRTAIYLSGGVTNQKASLSLGGAISNRLVRGMSPQYIEPVAGVVIEDATPENGPGIGTITITGNTAVYMPPDGAAGVGVVILPGQRKIVPGANVGRAVRLYRPSGAAFSGVATFRLVDAMNGVLAMSDVPDEMREDGGVHYRAFFIKANADVTLTKLWVTTDGQASYALAVEVPVADTIQTIPDAETAPTGVSWVSAGNEAGALMVGSLGTGQTRGIWIRRTFPAAGTVALKETINLHLQHQGL